MQQEFSSPRESANSECGCQSTDMSKLASHRCVHCSSVRVTSPCHLEFVQHRDEEDDRILVSPNEEDFGVYDNKEAASKKYGRRVRSRRHRTEKRTGERVKLPVEEAGPKACRQARRRYYAQKAIRKIVPHSAEYAAPSFLPMNVQYAQCNGGNPGIVHFVSQQSVSFPLTLEPHTLRNVCVEVRDYNTRNGIILPDVRFFPVYVLFACEGLYDVISLNIHDFDDWRYLSPIVGGRLLRSRFPLWFPRERIWPHGAGDPPDSEDLHSLAASAAVASLPSVESHCVDEVSMESSVHDDDVPINVNIKTSQDEKVSPTPSTKADDDSNVISQALDDISKYSESLDPSEGQAVSSWAADIENLLIFAYQAYRAQSYTDVLVAVCAYVKMYSKGKSIYAQIMECLNDFESSSNSDADEDSTLVNPMIGVQGLYDEIIDKWDLIKNHDMWKKVSYLISAGLSMTTCAMKEITWSPFGLKLVHIEAAKEQLGAIDFIDAVVRTFAWMCESGWQCFAEGSLAPLLYSNQRMREFHMLYDEVSAKIDTAVAGNHPDLGDFESKVQRATELVISLKKIKPDGTTASWLQYRYEKLTEFQEKLRAKRKNTSVRFAPIGWSISGPTGVGKSSVAHATMKTSLTSMGFSADSSRIGTHEEADNFQSTYTSDLEGLFIDDFANMSSQFAAGKGDTPASKLIRFFNNMAAQAIKAEIQLKGVVFIDFKCGVITTNVKHLDAHLYSNCPESVLRRFLHVSVDVREEFRKTGSVCLDPQNPKLVNSDQGIMTDVWHLTIEECRAMIGRDGKSTYTFEPVTCMIDGKKRVCKDLTFREYLTAVAELSKAHKASQDRVVDRCKSLETLEFCTECSLPKMPGYCKCAIKVHGKELMEHVQDIFIESAKSSFLGWVRSFTAPAAWARTFLGFRPIKRMSTRALANAMRDDLDNFCTPLAVSLVPEWIFNSRTFRFYLEGWKSTTAIYDLKKHLRRFSILSTIFFCVALYNAVYKFQYGGLLLWFITNFIGGQLLYAGYLARKRGIEVEYLERRDALSDYAKGIRDGNGVKFALGAVSLIIIAKAVMWWNSRRVETQSLHNPKDVNASKGWFHNMFGSKRFEYTSQEKAKFATASQACQKLTKNNWWVRFHREDGSTTRCNGAAMRSGVLVVPEHVFHRDGNMNAERFDTVRVEIWRGTEATSKCNGIIERGTYSVPIEGADAWMVFMPNLGNVADITHYLPVDKPTGNANAFFIVRDGPDSRCDTVPISVVCQQEGHQFRNFYGGRYDSPYAQEGACMGMIVADKNSPCILGFHIGGDGLGLGIMQTITKGMFDSAYEKLCALPGVIRMADPGTLPKTQCGRDVLVSTTVNPLAKSLLGYENGGAIQTLGATKLRRTATSVVQKSILSDHVEEIMGVPNKWGKPKLDPNWKAFNTTLEYLKDPALPFQPSLVEWAKRDYLAPLLPLAREAKFKPLTLKESIMGIPGQRFIDAIPMSTSMGFPIFGAKRQYFTEVYDGETLLDRVPEEFITTEINRMMDCWKKGERAYPVNCATLKDEPTKLDSAKVRVFQAAPVAMSILVRKYFLPVVRFLQMHPILSESAVGINCSSPEWKEFMDHCHKFAKDTGNDDGDVLAWDYSKYDVRMSSQITVATLEMFHQIAKAAGYSQVDLDIMETMITDMANPLMDWNGTLFLAFNSGTSGDSVTVNRNGGGGSLYIRIGAKTMYPMLDYFRDHFAIGTYGDDVNGSCDKNHRGFNYKTYKRFLEKHGIKITPPDKDSTDEDEFLPICRADFLKRLSHQPEGLPVPIGRLDENSILKSLHCNLKSKTASDREVALSTAESALHEWFAYGRDHYEMRRTQLTEIMDRVGIAPSPAFCPYDDRVQKWHETFWCD